jgi:hypothetical protein
MSLVTEVTIGVKATLKQVTDFFAATVPVEKSRTLTFQDGVGADQAQKVYAKERTIAPSANDDLDLSGSLVDPLGNVLAFTGIKLIRIIADPTNVNDVVVGNAAATQFQGPFGAVAHTVKIGPGDEMTFTKRSAAGWPVVNAASDLFRIANGGAGTSVKYQIIIVGI